MNRVLQLAKKLSSAPNPAPVPGFNLRSFAEQEDLAGWLALRQAAFAKEKLGVRAWNVADFHQEFITKPWWNPAHCWVVEASSQGQDLISPRPLVGSVTLAMRSTSTSSVPAVHWLMVHPRYRHAGIAKWLLATLEQQAWHLGHRTVCLETHSAWESAARFYEAAGYVKSESH